MKNNRKSNKSKKNPLYYGGHRCEIFEPIKVTEHAIKQYSERLKSVNTSREEIINLIKNQVKFSKLISLKGVEERRVHRDIVYVVKREMGQIVVITVLISQITKKELYSKDFSVEKINHEQYLNPKSHQIA